MAHQFLNIQVIDGAVNCVYDVFATMPEEFILIFPPGTDIAFIDEVRERNNADEIDVIFRRWQRRVRKRDAVGIHGTLFYDLAVKKRSGIAKRRDSVLI